MTLGLDFRAASSNARAGNGACASPRGDGLNIRDEDRHGRKHVRHVECSARLDLARVPSSCSTQQEHRHRVEDRPTPEECGAVARSVEKRRVGEEELQAVVSRPVPHERPETPRRLEVLLASLHVKLAQAGGPDECYPEDEV
eukprot:CAMPEP_0182804304 /NCGR_PEP_ID=MMETSP0006_2-20121128/4478_1 /TAXON_ID=97485 /ORGANISM="Prymnesium parvum, Strain Texoma1" /LENGTH=141 /DNA_ID=CAMNT_0024929811 /DNA_START=883 /DNA_END=1309 /DNA_ORIENTATION=-